MSIRLSHDQDEFPLIDSEAKRLLTREQERTLLGELAERRQRFQAALSSLADPCQGSGRSSPVDPASVVAGLRGSVSPACYREILALSRDYTECRTRLALANSRLVSHVAKLFRDRGVPTSDLIQEGFCGLLEAIDRFDLAHKTKLATYATWWIRQAMQRAVAAGAYPVRLSPRHLRQLAQHQRNGTGHDGPGRGGPSAAMIRHIHDATRPALSLDADLGPDYRFRLVETVPAMPEVADHQQADRSEAIARLLSTLRPREQEVVCLRFGLGGRPGLSLSQVGQELSVSKERVRQIQDRALAKLRSAADGLGLLAGA